MPIFEYKCNDCGKEFEELVYGQPSSVSCPDCASLDTDKLMSCCRHKSDGATDYGSSTSGFTGAAKGGCAGCSGGSCSTCK